MIAFQACEVLLGSVVELIDGELLADTGGPYARVRIDRWMVELISEFVESERAVRHPRVRARGGGHSPRAPNRSLNSAITSWNSCGSRERTSARMGSGTPP